MKTLLHVSVSPREYTPGKVKHQSISRLLAAQFINCFEISNDESKVIHRDLALSPPKFIDLGFIAACFAKDDLTQEQRLALSESDILINEIMQADVIVISTPMYNYGMPAVLKAWFDQVIRINKTFSFDLSRDGSPLRPILDNKTLVLLASWGESGFAEGESRREQNHLSPHVKQLAPFLGATQFFEVASQYQEYGSDAFEQSKNAALTHARALAQSLAKDQQRAVQKMCLQS